MLCENQFFLSSLFGKVIGSIPNCFKILNLFKTLILTSCSKLPISLFIVPFELCYCCSSFLRPSYASEEEEEKFIVVTTDDEEGSPQAETSD